MGISRACLPGIPRARRWICFRRRALFFGTALFGNIAMIGPTVIEEIQRLLAEGGLSQRKIAKVMMVSRGTVTAVASGKRRAYYPRPEDSDEQLVGPVRRCPGCGGMTTTPCRACRIRELKAQSPTRCHALAREEPLGLDLADEHRTRYEEIRRQRMPAAG